jgi:L-asparagine transporter-like permease
VSWTTSFLGLSSEINDAGPGVVLSLIGMFIMYITRPVVRIKSAFTAKRGK